MKIEITFNMYSNKTFSTLHSLPGLTNIEIKSTHGLHFMNTTLGVLNKKFLISYFQYFNDSSFVTEKQEK